MSVKIYYLSFFVLIYDWIGFNINADKMLSLDPAVALDDEDLDFRLVQKRFLTRTMDPLMRRSPLDKNFMRFGKRSEFKLTGKPESEIDRGDIHSNHNLEDILGVASDYKFLQDDSSKPKRLKQGFIRFGRGNQNFIRFGRGNNHNGGYLPIGRSDLNQLLSSQEEYHKLKSKTETDYHDPAALTYLVEEEETDERRSDDDKKNETKRKTGSNRGFLRLGRAGNFIRFGRNLEIGAPADNINYRLKRSEKESEHSQDGSSFPTLFLTDGSPVEFRRSSGFLRLGRGSMSRNGLIQTKDNRKKRSVHEAEPSQSSTADSKTPKIGFKGIVVVPTGTEGADKEKSESSESNSEKNELSEILSTEAPEVNFHIPSVRHKRETFEIDKVSEKIARDDVAFDNSGEVELSSSLLDSFTDSPENYFFPVVKPKPNSSKDYLVRIG